MPHTLDITSHPLFFLDIEAYGPPSYGSIMQIGMVRFSLASMSILDRWQWRIEHNAAIGDVDTIKWIEGLPEEAKIGQKAGKSVGFRGAYNDPTLAGLSALLIEDLADLVVLTDDWSDAAWLDAAIRKEDMTPLRGLANFMDVSIIVETMPPIRSIEQTRPLILHVALDDAEQGAIDFMRRSPFAVRGAGLDFKPLM